MLEDCTGGCTEVEVRCSTVFLAPGSTPVAGMLEEVGMRVPVLPCYCSIVVVSVNYYVTCKC